MTAADLAGEWEALGTRRRLLGHEIFVIDHRGEAEAGLPPLLVLHGYPTSSIDFLAVLGAWNDRRVVLFDMLGYGFSDKPDQRYSLFEQADIAEAVAADLDLSEVDLLTHDMGDSVGGEVLARSLEGALAFSIRRRAITNGSIYLDLAHLTDGQNLLLSLPDERLSSDLPAEALVEGLRGVLAPGFPSDDPHLLAAAELVVRGGGGSLQPRIIRYVEERRRHEDRWTGAIETHRAPLAVVWGDLDPVAGYPMAEKLIRARPDAELVRLEGVGHYPMIEAPDRFAAAVRTHLN